MATIKFYLKSTTDQETAIFARFSLGVPLFKDGKKVYSQFKYYISESINPKYWNPKKCRAKESKEFPVYPEFNAKLDTIESTIKSVLLKFEQEGIEPSAHQLRDELDQIIKPGTIKGDHQELEVRRMDLFQFIDHLIKTSNNKASTLKSYYVVKKNLTDYQTKTNRVLTFRNLDIDFYNQFVLFLKEEGLATNTIGTRIKVLKTFLSRASEMGIKTNKDYLKKSFSKPKEETFSVYLTTKELDDIYSLQNLPAYLDRTRDLFMIGCYTGLRFSDLSRLNKGNISDGDITIKTVKTGQKVCVPIHPFVRRIFEKYDYNLPKVPSNQKFNEFIREVAKRAKIDEIVSKEMTKGGFSLSQQYKKYQLISSHTARRSFATNAFLAGVSSIAIMKITGHKTESAFMKYIKMSAEDNAKKMQMHPFFNPMLIA